MEAAPEHSCAELGYVLAQECWGTGLMPEAVRRVIRFCFERMDPNRSKRAASPKTRPPRGSWRRRVCPTKAPYADASTSRAPTGI
jgi:Acetyltransferase (GNAT) domain